MNRTVVCVCVGIVLCALIALFPIESASASPAAPVEQVFRGYAQISFIYA